MMIRLVVLLFITALAACNNGANDRVENNLDSLGQKVDSAANKLWDSAKKEGRELKERIETRLEKKDTTEN